MPSFELDLKIAAVLALTLALTVVAFLLLWLMSVRLKNAGIVDAWWGPGFGMATLVALAFAPDVTVASAALAASVLFWSLRLGAHIGRRAMGETHEDKRYAAMRAVEGRDFARWSLTRVFLLQAALQWLLSLPLQLAMLMPAPALAPLHVAGAALFGLGFAIEAAADFQLARFKAKPGNRGRICEEGLWAWSRHPNYFGEALLWWGFWLSAVGGGLHVWTVFAPVLMTLLLTRVSGVPMTDAAMRESKAGWDDYAARTSAFLPWPPKRRKTGGIKA